MSIKAISKVWETSKQKGSALLLLLAIADYAKDDGKDAWPSLQTLAKKTRMGRRNVIKLVQKLEEAGELKVRREKGPNGVNFYDVIFQPVNPSSPPEKQASEPQFTPLVNPSSPELVNPSSPNPSIVSVNEPSSLGKILTPNQLMFGCLATVCKIDLTLISDKQRGQLNKESAKLVKANIQLEEITKFGEWWKAYDWRGQRGQPPLPSQVSENWGQFKEQNGRQPGNGTTPVTNKDAEAIRKALAKRSRPAQGTGDTTRDAPVR